MSVRGAHRIEWLIVGAFVLALAATSVQAAGATKQGLRVSSTGQIEGVDVSRMPGRLDTYIQYTGDPSGGQRQHAALLNPWGMPRFVYSTLAINEINKVDGVEQSFYVDAVLTAFYQEPALNGTFPPGFIGGLSDDIKSTLQDLNVYFDPKFANTRDPEVVYDRIDLLTSVLPLPISATSAYNLNPHFNLSTTPWIGSTMRVSGQFKANLALEDFPFDSQTVEIQYGTTVPAHIMEFADMDWQPGFSVTREIGPIIGWSIASSSTRPGSRFFPEYGIMLPMMTVELVLDRNPGYYINKIVIGVVFVTLMSQLSFLIDPRDTNRPMAAMTAFLGIVTYLFVIASDVPKVAYLTRMDRFVNASFYFVFADFALHLGAYVLVTYADAAEAAASAAEAARRKKYDDEGGAGGAGGKGASAATRDRETTTVNVHSAQELHHSTSSSYERDHPDGAAAAEVHVSGWWDRARTLQRRSDWLLLVASSAAYVVAVIVTMTT